MRTAEHEFRLSWVLVAEDSRLAGTSIGEAHLRKKTGASVVGVIRDGALSPNPDATFRFRASDLVAIIGSEQACKAVKDLAGSHAQDGQSRATELPAA